MKEKNKGITLIALIITIIIMLILVSVSINIAINNGLFTAAGKGAKETKNAQNAEQELAGGQVNIDGQIYSSIEEYMGTVGGKIIADGSFDGRINTPKLTADMTPVAWDKNGNEYVPTTNERWYNYDQNKWANAKTEDGSYWVWIPRYEYKITAPAEGEPAGTIDVRFIETSTKSGSTGYTTEDGITTSSDNYIIHPAFTNNVEVGGWDSELAGFWVAKYEMSMEGKAEEGEWTALETTSAENGNIATTKTITAYNVTASAENQLTTSATFGETIYTNIRAVSKPNVSSWRYINISNCYENAYNYDRTKESHLMKNSEWGAVAYLAHSKYGRDGEKVTKNGTGYVTAAGGKITSSTGNETGIYDLAGGAYEYVAAFNDAYSSTGNYYLNKSSIGTNMGVRGLENAGSTKYLTAYSNNTSTKIENFEIGKVSMIGDAIEEVWLSGDIAWHSACLGFVNNGIPFLRRGGRFSKDDANIFFVESASGGEGDGMAFRVICVF